MVWKRGHTRAGQPRRQRIYLAARGAVDDACLSPMPSEDLLELALQRPSRKHAVEKVGPIEGPNELQWVAERQLSGDVTPDPRRGRRGECVKACPRQQIAEP